MSEVEWLDIFSDNLVNIMDEYGITQRDLADDTGLSESTISRYVNKQQIPTLKAIINMSYALDIKLDDFIDFGARII